MAFVGGGRHHVQRPGLLLLQSLARNPRQPTFLPIECSCLKENSSPILAFSRDCVTREIKKGTGVAFDKGYVADRDTGARLPGTLRRVHTTQTGNLKLSHRTAPEEEC